MNAQKRVIDSIRSGEVLVIEARGELGADTIGDIMALRLETRGGAGFVTDGCVRDQSAIAQLDLPFYAAGSHQSVLGRRHVPVDSGLPITCGDVLVMPGDVVFGDGEGVVVVPVDIADDVAIEAKAQEAEERYIIGRVTEGESLVDLFPLSAARRAEYEKVAKGN